MTNMKFFKKFFSIVSILFFFSLVFNIYRFRYNLNDGFWRTVMFLFEGTIWAPKFTEVAFSQIRVGMSDNKIRGLVGDPLNISCDKNNICFWSYTHQDTQTADFDQRTILINQFNKVVEIRKSFFID